MAAALPMNLVTVDPAGASWLEGIRKLVGEMPRSTEQESRRGALLRRLAIALEEMSETLPPDHALLGEAVGWKDRADFEALLEAWESGGLPAVYAHG